MVDDVIWRKIDTYVNNDSYLFCLAFFPFWRFCCFCCCRHWRCLIFLPWRSSGGSCRCFAPECRSSPGWEPRRAGRSGTGSCPSEGWTWTSVSGCPSLDRSYSSCSWKVDTCFVMQGKLIVVGLIYRTHWVWKLIVVIWCVNCLKVFRNLVPSWEVGRRRKRLPFNGTDAVLRTKVLDIFLIGLNFN